MVLTLVRHLALLSYHITVLDCIVKGLLRMQEGVSNTLKCQCGNR